MKIEAEIQTPNLPSNLEVYVDGHFAGTVATGRLSRAEFQEVLASTIELWMKQYETMKKAK